MMQKRADTRSPRSVVIGPPPGGLVEGRRRHARRELDVAPQVEAVGDVVDVGEDLRLGGVPLAPLPLLLQLVRERVRVVHALDVAARARVAVPVPGAADAVARLEDARRAAPSWRRRWSVQSPANPAPTMTAWRSGMCPRLYARERSGRRPPRSSRPVEGLDEGVLVVATTRSCSSARWPRRDTIPLCCSTRALYAAMRPLYC